MGDFSVYKYYVGAVGRSAMTVVWSLQLFWAFMETFPSVWLKWWSTATTNNESPSTALYLGVYAAVQIGSLITLFVLAV
jgi:ATP-binding cassette subfamily C (CFTR/MRP) protein 1